jgi:Tfp pilus assembly protein PilO
MKRPSPALGVLRKPVVLLGAAGLVVVVLVWLFVFFVPQSHKLSSLQSEKTTLQQTVVQDDARLKQLRTESHHVGQIQALHSKLQGYVPAQEDLYTFIQTLSSAAKRTGVSISSLQPSTLVPATGTSYSAVPISADVKGTYDQLRSFVNAIYGLPRLTDINSVNITGGGPGTNRSTSLTATFDLAIFTSQKASTS